ncbi:MAG TPA: cupin domain-containing protein [Xanthobacteraceae bacterium]|nr:cupin domain-containing protein [Xanthobacteraceae bacterium]
MAKAATKRKAKSSARTAARKSSARRPVKAATKAKGPTKRRPKQTFVASHLEDAKFETGLRRYAQYRDLGIAKATGGLAQAHVIRMIPPCIPAEVSKRHYHDVDFQMIYVLKGWMKGEYDGKVVTMHEGSAWLQPPKIKHTVLDYSDDCEVLEIILPAEFETVEV